MDKTTEEKVDLIQQFKDAFAESQQALTQQPRSVCPNCGYCPHCGRGGHYTQPWYPQPNPWWQGPRIVYCGTTTNG